ncbi:MAG: hypothetical protein EI684_04385 [Candidatus Viridilinea halotolerans]|uniref:Uncharacterized protein n=1 Tax=Candidatus Viridilinea halotolerans TaxID=2491704 RepID=A0A426U6F5_9CHLR|nr:MAG: hypothetical protein EI684_04385 [Candidatus Viridilinea halotolerans]
MCQPIHLHTIPSLATATVYVAVLLETQDDARLLRLWVTLALYQAVDRAFPYHATVDDWAQRSGLPAEDVVPLLALLTQRGLITTPRLIPHGVLHQRSVASTEAARVAIQQRLDALHATQETLW